MVYSGEVLIVDDNPDVREAIAACLESWGYKVYQAQNGSIAKIQATQHRPNLILMDYNMPTANGAMVYDQLQQSPDTVGIPVIFVTAAPLDEVVGSVKLSPRVRFVNKPIEYQKLKNCIVELMSSISKDALPPSSSDPGEPEIVDLDEIDPSRTSPTEEVNAWNKRRPMDG